MYGVEPVVKFHLALVALLAAQFSFAQAAAPEASPPAVSVPPLRFQHETLPNGLQVYSVEDHSSPDGGGPGLVSCRLEG